MKYFLVVICIVSATGCCLPCGPCTSQGDITGNALSSSADTVKPNSKLTDELAIIYGEKAPAVSEQPPSASQSYTVQKGDNIYEIGRKFHIPPKSIISANNLADPGNIKTGQKLLIPGSNGETPALTAPSPASAPAKIAPPSNLQVSKNGYTWPVDNGWVLFNNGSDGICLKAPEGANVRAVNAGTVKFASEALQGFGKTVIIEHSNNVLSLYAYNSQLTVKQGDKVERGATIAIAGNSGRATSTQTLFRMFKNSKPANPMNYLPER
ncbi:MAG: M23 family metallopeptidase [Planctomycetes bacterium]|nr:M23 family metallopeptidase [Planctomycetota bacterium]